MTDTFFDVRMQIPQKTRRLPMSCGRNHAEKGWSIVRGKKSSATMSVAAAREVSGMPGNKYHNGYREDEELYVYDQSCENCRF